MWTARGTRRGPLLNIPATGRQVEVRGVSVLTYRERKLFRALYLWDLAGLLRDIGLLPSLSASAGTANHHAAHESGGTIPHNFVHPLVADFALPAANGCGRSMA